MFFADTGAMPASARLRAYVKVRLARLLGLAPVSTKTTALLSGSEPGAWVYVGEVLHEQPVGLRQIDADEWELSYGPVLLGHVLVRKGQARIQPLR